MDATSIPPELQLTPAMIAEYNILKYKVAYTHVKLGTATYEITTKTGNYLLKLIAPSAQKLVLPTNALVRSKYTKVLKGSSLLALKCSQLSTFPKIVSHKTVNDVMQILIMAPGKKLTEYVTQSEGIRLKDLMYIFGQLINALLDLTKLAIKHYVISMKAIYITPSKRVNLTEILPDITSFVGYQDAISGEDGLQLPPEVWEEGALGKKELTISGHIYVLGHYFLKLINLNPHIVNFTQSVSSGQTSVLAECSNEQLTFILDLINGMVDMNCTSRPTAQELLFYFRLFSLGNSGAALQISTFMSNTK